MRSPFFVALLLTWIGTSHEINIRFDNSQQGSSRVFFVNRDDQSRSNVQNSRRGPTGRRVLQRNQFDNFNLQIDNVDNNRQNRLNANTRQDQSASTNNRQNSFENRNFQQNRRTQPSRNNMNVHGSQNGRQYHYSWRIGRNNFRQSDAVSYCSNLDDGWQLLSLETRQENDFIVGIIAQENPLYSWTSGRRQGGSDNFVWDTGVPVGNFNWGQTGSKGEPQPDNAERGIEDCLAILNRFYPNDGITLHDIACFYEKPLICERAEN